MRISCNHTSAPISPKTSCKGERLQLQLFLITIIFKKLPLPVYSLVTVIFHLMEQATKMLKHY